LDSLAGGSDRTDKFNLWWSVGRDVNQVIQTSQFVMVNCLGVAARISPEVIKKM